MSIQIPPVVYKYRDWSNPEHKRLLTNCEINFAPPIDCQEQHECNLSRDYDSVNEGLLYKYYYHTAPNYGYYSHEDRDNIAKMMVKNSPMNDIKHRERTNERFRAIINRDLSIFCVSPYKDVMNLWEVFADGHMGFCVGFDSAALMKYSDYFGSGGNVVYYDTSNPPKIRPFTFSKEELIEDMMKMIYSLPDIFVDEKEYRFSKLYIPNRQLSVDVSCFKEIILGSSISEKDKDEITTIVKKQFPKVEFSQAKCDIAKESFEFYGISLT